MGGSRGATGGPDSLKNHKNIEFLSNTGPDPLKNDKATKPAFKSWANIGPPAKHHLNGVLLEGRLWPAVRAKFGCSLPSSTKKQKNKQKPTELDPL